MYFKSSNASLLEHNAIELYTKLRILGLRSKNVQSSPILSILPNLSFQVQFQICSSFSYCCSKDLYLFLKYTRNNWIRRTLLQYFRRTLQRSRLTAQDASSNTSKVIVSNKASDISYYNYRHSHFSIKKTQSKRLATVWLFSIQKYTNNDFS